MNMLARVLVLALLATPCLTHHGTTDGPVFDPAEQFEYDSALPVGYPLPQTTTWALPYAQGPVRVLFFTAQNPNVNVLPNRLAVELLHRFDLEASAVRVQTGMGDAYAIAYAGGAGIVGEEAGLERLQRLMQQDYDC